jgi:Ca2+-binding EF-hand superfamily protein
MKQLSKAFDLGLDEVKLLLKKFQAVDVDRSGTIDIQEFCAALELPYPPTEYGLQLFSMFDKDGEVTCTTLCLQTEHPHLLFPRCLRNW